MPVEMSGNEEPGPNEEHGPEEHGSKEQPPLPEQLYFRIGEAARLVGVEPHVLRYWEKEFPKLRPSKSSGKQRRYRKTDIFLLRRIRALLHEQGFTIAGARKALDDRSQSGASHAQAQGAVGTSFARQSSSPPAGLGLASHKGGLQASTDPRKTPGPKAPDQTSKDTSLLLRYKQENLSLRKIAARMRQDLLDLRRRVGLDQPEDGSEEEPDP